MFDDDNDDDNDNDNDLFYASLARLRAYRSVYRALMVDDFWGCVSGGGMYYVVIYIMGYGAAKRTARKIKRSYLKDDIDLS